MPPPREVSQQGLVQLVPGPGANQGDIHVDIVAVPGLGADPKRSFGSETETPGRKNFNWLSDSSEGIRAEIPTARVLLYEYDSRWLGADALKQTLYNVALWLLDALVSHRRGCETRPLVFLAHSMGGLVVTKALTLAAAKPELVDRVRIYECFAGAIFFGTPFRGSSESSRGYALATFLQKFHHAIPNQMLQVLDPERDTLEELRNDFSQLATREPRASIACFYELRETSYVGKGKLGVDKMFKEIVVTQESAVLDFADLVRGMECDHRQLNRFDNTKDQRYDTVRSALKDIVNKSRLTVKRRLNASKQSVIDDTTFERLSNSLNVVDFRGVRRKIKSASGESSWILKEPKFCKWATLRADDEFGSNNAGSCIWISGSEGQGKSKAALAAIEELERHEKTNRNDETAKSAGIPDVLVAYFFCDSSPDSRTPENLLRSLIWQLVLKRRNLGQYVKGLATQDKSRSTSVSHDSTSVARLWRALREMLCDPSVQTVYFVINNMHYWDEEEHSTGEFLQILASDVLADPENPNDELSKARWMFLSRARSHIKSTMLSNPNHEILWVNLEDGSLDAELHAALRSYTRDRVKTLAGFKGYSLALQYFVTEILKKRAENNTLWVEVVCRLLEGLPSDHVRVRRTLEALPQDLPKLISRTWSEALSVESENIHMAKEILRTLAVLFEDPTIDELKVLAELDSEASSEKIVELVRSCGPLLRIFNPSEDDSENDSVNLAAYKVTFVHPLAKDALLGEKKSRMLIGLSEDDEDKSEEKWQHGIVALRCFSYTLKQLQTDDENANWGSAQQHGEGGQNGEDTQNENKEDHEFNMLVSQIFPAGELDGDEDHIETLMYPSKYWLRHGNASTPAFVETLDPEHGFWAMESTIRRRWWANFVSTLWDDEDVLRGLTSLHVAAYFGSLPLIDQLMKTGHEKEIHVLDSWNNQPLHWAANEGHIDVIERLIRAGSDVNNGLEAKEWTPLHMAASTGQIQAMKALLSGRFGAVTVDAVATGDGTPLTLAIAWNEEEAARLLLDYGASPVLTSNDFDSPLSLAAMKGYDDLVDRLIGLGATQNMISRDFGSALSAAASAGHVAIVEKLLPWDQDHGSRQRALKEAAENGFNHTVQLLQRNTTQLHLDEAFELAAAKGHKSVVNEIWAYHQAYRTLSQQALNNALYKATDNEKEDMVEILLKFGASPDATGEEYGNALTASAYDGTVNILRKLIAAGAGINDPNGFALQAASSQGAMDVVVILLDNGAFVNAVSDKFSDGTALQAASVAGHHEIAKVLLDRGADPNLGRGDFTNPLTAATAQAHTTLLQLLLERRANPNVSGGSDGTTPLINASATLPMKDLDLLIRYGAQVNTVDPEGDTALICSAQCGDDECVKLLLGHQAKIDFCGAENGTALHAAASRRHTDTCKLLISEGADLTIRGGPWDTVMQAACHGGDTGTLRLVLSRSAQPGGDNGKGKNNGLQRALGSFQQRFKGKISIDTQGGRYGTVLHAAAVEPNDGCLRLVLDYKPSLNIVAGKPGEPGTTALQAACLVGCNRNARLLIEAGADVNVVAGPHGTALQAAALKGSRELVELLLKHGERIKDEPVNGRYGSALTAAVVREFHEDNDNADTDQEEGDGSILNVLLSQAEFSAPAYRAALECAVKLGRRNAFRTLWISAKDKIAKKSLNLGLKGLTGRFHVLAQKELDRKAAVAAAAAAAAATAATKKALENGEGNADDLDVKEEETDKDPSDWVARELENTDFGEDAMFWHQSFSDDDEESDDDDDSDGDSDGGGGEEMQTGQTESAGPRDRGLANQSEGNSRAAGTRNLPIRSSTDATQRSRGSQHGQTRNNNDSGEDQRGDNARDIRSGENERDMNQYDVEENGGEEEHSDDNGEEEEDAQDDGGREVEDEEEDDGGEEEGDEMQDDDGEEEEETQEDGDEENEDSEDNDNDGDSNDGDEAGSVSIPNVDVEDVAKKVGDKIGRNFSRFMSRF